MTPNALPDMGVRAARIRSRSMNPGFFRSEISSSPPYRRGRNRGPEARKGFFGFCGQATTEVVLLFPIFMLLLFAMTKLFALLILVQKMEVASYYAARRWQLESHRNVDYEEQYDKPVLLHDIEVKVSQYLGFDSPNEKFLDLVRLTGPGARLEVTRTQVWNVVTLTVRTAPMQIAWMYKSPGFTFEVTKYVPNRDRPIAFVLPGLQG